MRDARFAELCLRMCAAEQKHEYGLFEAAAYIMLPIDIEREFVCQLAVPWGTHLISPELAEKM